MSPHDGRPVHRPGPALEAPIPGVHWYGGCDPDLPTVDPRTGRCSGCGEEACVVCGRSNCPDHVSFSVQGWEPGEDCQPPEPGKEWLTIAENGEELAVIVHRNVASARAIRPVEGGLSIAESQALRTAKEVKAAQIVAALNNAVLNGDWTP